MDFGVEKGWQSIKLNRHTIKIMMRFEMDFGWLLDRCLIDVRPNLGAKLAPNAVTWWFQDDVKNSDENRQNNIDNDIKKMDPQHLKNIPEHLH